MKQGLIASLCALWTWFGMVPSAAALSCSGTFTMEFGTINALDGPDETTSSILSVTCSGGAPDDTIRACVAIEATRQMTWTGLSGGVIDYELSNTEGGASWASDFGQSTPSGVITLNSQGEGGFDLPLHGRIASPQTTAPTQRSATRYVDTPLVTIRSDSVAGNPDCSTLSGSMTTQTGSVGADYEPACHLTTAPLNFGTLASTLSAVDAATSITARCSTETLFTIGMNYGGNGGVDPSVRYMRNGNDLLTYGLYLDSARVQGWGYTLGVNVYNGTGNGTQVTIPVYGRVNAQPTPPSGTYTDTVIVTIDY